MDSRFDNLFLQARELTSPAEQAAFLDEACAGDREMRLRLEAKLGDDDAAAEFFGDAVTRVHPSGHPAAPGEEPGTIIGTYKLLQQIGEGGFGTVWMADQQAPVRRRVALKVIKPGLDTKEVIARFEQERQALAMMDHANIARVFDAGATQSGRPFFVMELVRGPKITEYCDEHGLAIPDRVRLFIQVCHAVHHAHQKGIIHRDIKPSNVLVTINDGEAVVKVIDFGVAKATQGSLSEGTLFTQFHQMIGTPAYMSPEQAEMTSLDIDTRSDIYSLGVLLYELITGRTPIDTSTLARAGLDEIRRVIREVTPPRPSARLKTLSAEELTTTAKRRRTESTKLTTSLRGDLDWIAMMCLEKDRKRRYDSANALASDLQRYLAHGIVAARPPTASYLLGRIVRRHRFAVAAAAAVLVTLVAGIVATVLMAVRATTAEGKTEERRKDAEREKLHAIEETKTKDRVLDFLVSDLLLQADTREQQKRGETAAPDLTMKEALDRASARIGDRFSDKPEEEATIRNAIGVGYAGVGKPKLAIPQFERSILLIKGLFGPTDQNTFMAASRLLDAYNGDGQFKKAVALGEETLKLATAAEGFDSEPALTMKFQLAQAYSNGGDIRKGLALTEELVQAYAAKGGEKGLEAVKAQLSLAISLAINGQHPRAVELYENVLQWQRDHLPPDSTDLAATLNGLGASYGFLNEAAKALPLYIEALGIMEKVRGKDHEETLRVTEGLARTYEMLEDREKHRELVERVAKGMAALGEDHISNLQAQARLAAQQFDSGQKDEGIALLEKTVAREKSVLSDEHPDTIASIGLLGRLYYSSGRFDDAIRQFETARDLSRKSGAPPQVTGKYCLNLGVNYIEKDRLTDGNKMLAEAWELYKQADGTLNQEFFKFIRDHIAANEQRKRPDVVAALKQLLAAAEGAAPAADPVDAATEAVRLGAPEAKPRSRKPPTYPEVR